MRATFEKFLFLAVMLVVAVVGNQVGAVRPVENSTASNLPEVILPSPSAVVGAALESIVISPSVAEAISLLDAPQVASVSSQSTAAALKKISEELPPLPQSQSVLVADVQSGEPYHSFEAERRWPTASLTKLMAAALAMRNMDANAKIELLTDDFRPGEMNLRSGETYYVKDLIRAMLVFSSNEAARAVARNYRGDFMADLNKLAEEWGMPDTHFAEPTGLASSNQSTARDLLVMARRVYQEYPNILEVSRKTKVTLSDAVSGQGRSFVNTNTFAGETNFIGGKTGFTRDAGENLLTIFNHRNRPVFIVVLGSTARFDETRELINWFRNNYR
ncbi:MAG: serine hydrolase [Patescibacteria group bacterium]